MNHVRLTVPATSANLGPGFDALGLALGLRNAVEMEIIAGGFKIDIQGEGASLLPRDASNAVARAVERVFQQVGEHTPPLRINLTNVIPPGSGLGSSAAAYVGGMVAANALLDQPLSRDDLLRLAVEMEGHPDNACAAMLGGLVISSFGEEGLIYRRVPVAAMKVVVARPDVHVLTEELRALLPKSILLKDAAINIGRAALVVQALAEGDTDLLGEAMHDRLHEPYRKMAIPGYGQTVAAALEAGAASVAISGSGPSLIAFASEGHQAIARAMTEALERATGKPVKAWILPVDPQGVQVAE